jgi:hypothetical protein
MSKFRCSNVEFPFEIGRWANNLSMKEYVVFVRFMLEMNQ